jgi:hypothetical protein
VPEAGINLASVSWVGASRIADTGTESDSAMIPKASLFGVNLNFLFSFDSSKVYRS